MSTSTTARIIRPAAQLTHVPLCEQSPAEIDNQLFPLWQQMGEITHRISRILNSKTYQRTLRPDQEKEISNLRVQHSALGSESKRFCDEYVRRGRWSRVFHVLNGNGHSHRSTYCQTCHSTTRFAYRPDMSGLSEDDIIGEIGETACTVCYPDAPLNPRYKDAQKRTAQERADIAAQKRAEKDKKAQDAAEKAISHPEDAPMFGVKTHREARIRLVDDLEWIAINRKWMEGDPGRADHYERNIEEHTAVAQRMAEALAHKEGITVEKALAEGAARLKKRPK